jgi:hypothetical protein
VREVEVSVARNPRKVCWRGRRGDQDIRYPRNAPAMKNVEGGVAKSREKNVGVGDGEGGIRNPRKANQ